MENTRTDKGTEEVSLVRLRWKPHMKRVTFLHVLQ
jgi:hypothetical protein